MKSIFVLCFLTLLVGIASAVVNLGSEHVIIRRPHVVLAHPTEPEETGHDHVEVEHEDQHEASRNATRVNTTLAVTIANATEMNNSTHGLEDDLDYPTVGQEVDENGCQLRIRNELERKCFSKFEDTVASSLHTDNEAESEKAVCCALEEYEKCCFRGYKVANCPTDRDSLKETLKAARIFLGAITKNSCSGHRGKCDLSSAGHVVMSSVLMTCSAVLVSFVALV